MFRLGSVYIRQYVSYNRSHAIAYGVIMSKKQWFISSVFMSLSLAFQSQALAVVTVDPNEQTSTANYLSTTMDNDQATPQTVYETGEIEQLLAPIALYPDTLLSHILIATTYPLELIEAYRFKEKFDYLNTNELMDEAESQDWDPSVKALLPFEHILKTLHDDLTWTQRVGSAFLSNEKQVLASIQSLRHQAKMAGNLGAMENVRVQYEQEKIIIEPIQKEVIYVPYYDTQIVYGYWPWRYYPPVRWSHHEHLYSRHRLYHWTPAIAISTAFYFSGFHWSNHYIAVDYDYRAHYRGHRHSHYYSNRKHHNIIKSSYAKHWRHNPHHRKNVSYKVHGNKTRHFEGYSKAVSHHNKKRVLDTKKYVNNKTYKAAAEHKSKVSQHAGLRHNQQSKFKQEVNEKSERFTDKHYASTLDKVKNTQMQQPKSTHVLNKKRYSTHEIKKSKVTHQKVVNEKNQFNRGATDKAQVKSYSQSDHKHKKVTLNNSVKSKSDQYVNTKKSTQVKSYSNNSRSKSQINKSNHSFNKSRSSGSTKKHH